MNGEYFRPGGGIGQVDEENFIQPSLADQLGWQLFDDIGGGDDEYRGRN